MSDKEEELILCSEAVRKALMANDSDTLSRLYLENYQGFSIRGDRESIDMIREFYQPGAVKLKAYQVKEQQVEVFGEVGIITGKGYVRGSYGENEFEHNICFTDIFLYREGRWQCYRSHACELV